MMENLKSSLATQHKSESELALSNVDPVKSITKKEEDKKFLEEINERIKSLPFREKFKAIALNNLYLERKALEEDLEAEIRKITLKYETKYLSLYEKANEIIDGVRMPSPEELKGQEKFLTTMEKNEKNPPLDASVVQGYWGKVIRNCDLLVKNEIAHEIKEKDDPVFDHLSRVEYQKLENGIDFSIRFHFDKNNPYFNNVVLEKIFIMFDEETPWKSKGTAIEWKPEKDLTQKLVKRITERMVDDESFFLFFKTVSPDDMSTRTPGQDPNDQKVKEEHINERMQIDFDIARIIIEDMIPFSLEYYLGMVVENEDISEDEDSETENRQGKRIFEFTNKELKKSSEPINIKSIDDSNYSGDSNRVSPTNISPKISKKTSTKLKKGLTRIG